MPLNRISYCGKYWFLLRKKQQLYSYFSGTFLDLRQFALFHIGFPLESSNVDLVELADLPVLDHNSSVEPETWTIGEKWKVRKIILIRENFLKIRIRKTASSTNLFFWISGGNIRILILPYLKLSDSSFSPITLEPSLINPWPSTDVETTKPKSRLKIWNWTRRTRVWPMKPSLDYSRPKHLRPCALQAVAKWRMDLFGKTFQCLYRIIVCSYHELLHESNLDAIYNFAI